VRAIVGSGGGMADGASVAGVAVLHATNGLPASDLNNVYVTGQEISAANGHYTFWQHWTGGAGSVNTIWKNGNGWGITSDLDGDIFDYPYVLTNGITWTYGAYNGPSTWGNLSDIWYSTLGVMSAMSALYGTNWTPAAVIWPEYYRGPIFQSQMPLNPTFNTMMVTNLTVAYLTASNGISLDNSNFICAAEAQQAGGAFLDYNRYGYRHTLDKIHKNQQFRVLRAGDGLQSHDLTYYASFSNLTNFWTNAGFITTKFETAQVTQDPTWKFSVSGSATTSIQDGLYVHQYAILNNLNGQVRYFQRVAGNGVMANIGAVYVVREPGAGHIKIETNLNNVGWNTVPGMGNLDCSAVRSNGFVFAWTNTFAAPTEIRVTEMDSGRFVKVLDSAVINSTVTNGFLWGDWSGSVGPGTCTWSNQLTTNLDIIYPIFQWMAPDLIIDQRISWDADSYFFKWLDFIQTNTPNADYVGCGIYPVEGPTTWPGLNTADEAVTLHNLVMREQMRNRGFSYFDGHSIFVDTNTVVVRGFIEPDGIHPTPTVGAFAYNKLLTHWLDLRSALGGEPPVATLARAVMPGAILASRNGFSVANDDGAGFFIGVDDGTVDNDTHIGSDGMVFIQGNWEFDGGTLAVKGGTVPKGITISTDSVGNTTVTSDGTFTLPDPTIVNGGLTVANTITANGNYQSTGYVQASGGLWVEGESQDGIAADGSATFQNSLNVHNAIAQQFSVSIDPSTGLVSLNPPATVNAYGTWTFPNTLTVSSGGNVTAFPKYNNDTLAGQGLVEVVSFLHTNTAQAVKTNLLFTAPQRGMYRFNAKIATTAGASGTVTVAFDYADDLGVITNVGSVTAGAGIVRGANTVASALVKSGQAVNAGISSSISGGTYYVDWVLEKLQ
jgi:hypothetical protein